MGAVAQMRHKSPQSLDVVPIKGGIVQIIAISPRRLQGVTQGAINPVGIRSLPGEQKAKLGQGYPSRSRGEISQVAPSSSDSQGRRTFIVCLLCGDAQQREHLLRCGSCFVGINWVRGGKEGESEDRSDLRV